MLYAAELLGVYGGAGRVGSLLGGLTVTGGGGGRRCICACGTLCSWYWGLSFRRKDKEHIQPCS